MKNIVLKSVIILIFISLLSCGTIRVSSDYDSEADFSNYKTFAFYKSGIDNVEISDIDKKRILKSIQNTLFNKGLTIDENPDILINIATKSVENIYIDNNFYSPYYIGWYPHYGRSYNRVAYSSSEGVLYIDVIDTNSKQLIWQGKGIGALSSNKSNRDELLNNLVTKILDVYPPEKETK
ncbi:MAG: DUF4136 domain-containing protein [Flavobacteriaceae bacterium]|nr:DUF4136 domain-containing protein [Flavobacteriaceae bacterium]